MSLGGSVSPVPCCVQVVVKVTHPNAKLANVIVGVIRDFRDRAIKLFFGFSQVEKDGVAIHKREMPNDGAQRRAANDSRLQPRRDRRVRLQQKLLGHLSSQLSLDVVGIKWPQITRDRLAENETADTPTNGST